VKNLINHASYPPDTPGSKNTLEQIELCDEFRLDWVRGFCPIAQFDSKYEHFCAEQGFVFQPNLANGISRMLSRDIKFSKNIYPNCYLTAEHLSYYLKATYNGCKSYCPPVLLALQAHANRLLGTNTIFNNIDVIYGCCLDDYPELNIGLYGGTKCMVKGSSVVIYQFGGDRWFKAGRVENCQFSAKYTWHELKSTVQHGMCFVSHYPTWKYWWLESKREISPCRHFFHVVLKCVKFKYDVNHYNPDY
jgi:hypothetical protein